MTILAVLDGALADDDPAGTARQLQKAINRHRSALDVLFDQRRLHAAALRGAGWKLAPIGQLYGLTPERVRQLISPLAASTVEAVAG